MTATLYCSFCGKSQHEVSQLIAGGSAFICDECICWCNQILDECEAEKRKEAAIYEARIAEYGPFVEPAKRDARQ